MYNSIDVEVLKPLIKQGLCVNKMAKVTGYSKQELNCFASDTALIRLTGNIKRSLLMALKCR